MAYRYFLWLVAPYNTILNNVSQKSLLRGQKFKWRP